MNSDHILHMISDCWIALIIMIWKEYSRHMESYISERTVGKYSIDGGKQMDMMSVSDKRICVWNVMKDALRGMNGNGKENDLQKMAHYAQLAWNMDGGMVK